MAPRVRHHHTANQRDPSRQHTARNTTRGAAITTGKVWSRWSPHLEHEGKQHAQRKSACPELLLEGAMRTHIADRRPSDGTPLLVTSWAKAYKPWSSSGGPRMKDIDGNASRA